jgi:hypothetical protein
MTEHGFLNEEDLYPTHPDFIRSMNTTSQILTRVKKRVDNVPIIAFSVDNPNWIGNTLETLSNQHAFLFISGIPEAIKIAKKSGIIVDGSPYDVHWNNIGHTIAGDIILNYLLDNKLIIQSG